MKYYGGKTRIMEILGRADCHYFQDGIPFVLLSDWNLKSGNSYHFSWPCMKIVLILGKILGNSLESSLNVHNKSVKSEDVLYNSKYRPILLACNQ